jgi:hypothetical protein
MQTTETKRSMNQCLVTGLLERLLGNIEPGHVLVASVDFHDRVVGLQSADLGGSQRTEDVAWQLRAAVARRAHGVIVGVRSPSMDVEALARTLATALDANVLGIVVDRTRSARETRQSDMRSVQAASNGWLRRSTA